LEKCLNTVVEAFVTTLPMKTLEEVTNGHAVTGYYIHAHTQ